MKAFLSLTLLCAAPLAHANTEQEVLKHLEGSWCSSEKAHLIMDHILATQPSVCVEIGVFSGSSLLPIAVALKDLNHGHVYAIDAYSNKEAVRYIEPSDANYPWWSTVDMEEAKSSCKEMLSSWKLTPYCTLIETPSRDVSTMFENIDFLHLDGSFSRKETASDIALYLPMVPSGGHILVSNAWYQLNDRHEKMGAVLTLFDTCDVIAETDHHNTILFQKR